MVIPVNITQPIHLHRTIDCCESVHEQWVKSLISTWAHAFEGLIVAGAPSLVHGGSVSVRCAPAPRARAGSAERIGASSARPLQLYTYSLREASRPPRTVRNGRLLISSTLYTAVPCHSIHYGHLHSTLLIRMSALAHFPEIFAPPAEHNGGRWQVRRIFCMYHSIRTDIP